MPSCQSNRSFVADWAAFQTCLDQGQGPVIADVWYLGANYTNYLKLQERLPQGVRLHSCGRRLNQLFDHHRDKFINLDRDLASGRFRRLWTLSDLAERNPFTSHFVTNCCRALILLEVLRSQTPSCFVVDDPNMARALSKVAALAGLQLDCQLSESPVKSLLRRALQIVGRRIRQGMYWLESVRRLKAVRADAVPRWSEMRTRKTMIVSWCTPRSFGGSDGLQPDAYFGTLPADMGGGAERIAWFGNPMDWLHGIDKMGHTVASAADPVVLPQDLWRSSDILWALVQSLALPLALRPSFRLGEDDLTPILSMELIEELASTRLAWALLYGRTIRRLIQLGVQPETVVFPYERQPWEMALLSVLRDELPGTRIIAYMHAPLASRFISFLPSRQEVGSGLRPDLILVVGEHFRRTLIEAGIPEQAVMTIGAFRFEGVFQRLETRPKNVPPVILCACPIDFAEAVELVRKVAAALAHCDSLRMLVNFHPAADHDFRARMEAALRAIIAPERVEYSDQPAARLLPQVACVVYNASGVVFEAGCLGVPAVFVGSELGLDLDKLPGGTAPPATSEDLAALLVGLCKDAQTAEAMSREIAQRGSDAFAAPNRERVSGLL